MSFHVIFLYDRPAISFLSFMCVCCIFMICILRLNMILVVHVRVSGGDGDVTRCSESAISRPSVHSKGQSREQANHTSVSSTA